MPIYLKPYIGPTNLKLVVAFDIGTTFSGISYSILRKGETPVVRGVTRFPAQAQLTEAKVPSLLYYDENGNVRAAGAEVLTGSVIETALTEGWTKAEWWTLHLFPKNVALAINDDILPRLPPRKSAVDVLADFIKYLFTCAKSYIQEHHLTLVWSSIEDSIEYVFTHPNGWETVRQQQYRQAIERAGLIPSTPEGRSRVHILTDGEASLHFCIANHLEPANQSTPQGVVIIDAGGRLQGSVFVTRRARTLLERKLDGREHSSPDDLTEFTREFDQTTKFTIKSDREPAYVSVGGLRTRSAEYNISFGKLRLTGEEATSLFNDSVDTIISAFEQQRKFATTPIQAAFIVGELSTNNWLWSRVQSYFSGKGISICRPDNHINKVVANGAVLFHLGLSSTSIPNLTNKIVRPDDQHWEAGAFGDVFRCQYTSDDGVKEVAVKAFRFSFSVDDSEHKRDGGRVVRMIRRELGLWRRLNHPNIVPFLGITYGFGKQGSASLVLTWMPHGTLHRFLTDHEDRLVVAHRLQLLLDIGNGLCYLHSLPVMHGDLSCNNVLLDRNYNACLADFGCASLVGEFPEGVTYLKTSAMRAGTLRWAAPEHFKEDTKQTIKSDVYSFGNMALLALTGNYPWSELQFDVAVMLHLSQGRKPGRPLMRPIDDEHWALIQRWWSPVPERPLAEDLVSSLEQLLAASDPPLPPLCELFRIPTGGPNCCGNEDFPVNERND